MDLTTIARVKPLVDQTTVGQDALLGQLITGISDQVETYLARAVEEKARTEQYDVELGQRRIFLRAYPVKASPVATFRNDSSRQFTTISDIAADSFHLDLERGEADFDRIRLIAGPGTLQAVYTGGMGTNTAAFIAAFPGVAQAVDIQVAHVFQRRHQLGIASFSADGGSISLETPFELIPMVKTALRRFRRFMSEGKA